MVYQYEWSYNKYPVSASDAGREFERIEAKEGSLTARNLLDESRNDDAVMHPCFEWDDEVAAEKYRITQGSEMIRNLVRVVIIEQDNPKKEETVTVRAFHRIDEKPNERGHFVNVVKAFSTEDTKQIVMRNALYDIEKFRTKYLALKEYSDKFQDLFEAIDELTKEAHTR